MARKPTPTTELVEAPELDSEKLSEIGNTGALLASTANEERDTLNQLIGQIQMTGAIAKLTTVVGLTKLAYIKENRMYKALAGKKGTDRNGNEIADVGTWEGFCLAIGTTRQKADEDLLNLKAFGEDALEDLNRVGAGYREMRQFRKLPDDSKQALMEVAKTGDKEAFVELAEEVISKHTKEKESLEKELSEVKADYEARGERLHKKNEELEAAQFALDRAEHRLKIATPDEQFADLRDECHAVASRVEDEFRTALTAALEALQEHGQANEEDLTPWMSSLILRMQRQLDAVRLKFGLPDVLEGEEPSWLNPDAVAAIEADVEARLASKEA
uniref:DUF3102 domain-containing protein n=1 Tax=Marinobacter nauticus TaxID=2743 RepID=A0A455WI10_MARNT|nr:hypothetical protein YBY_30270 [Marinobacter nauticus]